MPKPSRGDARPDPGLEAIAGLEAALVAAYDQKIAQGVSAEELKRQRPGVVTLAATVAERLRAEYAARSRQP